MGILRTSAMIRQLASRRLTAAAVGLIAAIAGGSWTGEAHGQSLRALTTFGSNGWLAPGSNAFLGTGNNERGLAFNPVTKSLVLASRNSGNRMAYINSTTGIVTGSTDGTGISGGTLLLMNASVSSDGQIFSSNLASTGGTLKIYRWANEASTGSPSVPFSLAVPTSTNGTWQFGNTLDVIGSGTEVKFVTAGSTTGTSNSQVNNGNFLIGRVDNSNFNTIYRTIPGTAVASNDYRLSTVFVDSNTVIGKGDNAARVTDFVVTGSGQTTSNATVYSSLTSGTAPLGSTGNFRILDYIEMGGRSYLGIMNTSNSLVNVYDITTAMTTGSGSTPVLMGSLTTQVGPINGNGNAAGQLAWGDVTQPAPESPWYYEARLYALNTNNGIQAMIFSVPEPSSWAMLSAGAVACGAAACSRKSFRRRRNPTG